MNKRRLFLAEDPTHYDKPTAASDNSNKVKRKRLSRSLPSDDSTDSEAGEEEAAVIADQEPRIEEEKMKNLTSRQRAMLKGGKGSSRIEFPDGLPPAPSRSKNE